MANRIKRNKLDGQKFGNLLVLELQEIVHYNKGTRKKWKCLCDCGKVHIVDASDLTTGHTTSCGCNKGKNKLGFGEATRNAIYSSYKRQAEKRNYEFNLTLEQSEKLFNGNCYYCGVAPSQTYKNTSRNYGGYIYNGIDRLDNTKGYSLDNCVSCCGRCNRAKDTWSEDEYKQWIEQSYKNLFQ